jgi:hypothetical protein
MPLLILSIIVQIGLILHVVRTGRPMYWIFIILMAPGIGSLAYAIVELLPDLSSSGQGRRAMRGIRKTLDPGGDLRQRQREHKLSGSVDAARHLAGELMENGQHDEAIEHYEKSLTGLYEYDPDLLLGLATARFQNEDFEKARAVLDLLIEHNPDFKSQDGHLLYARSVAACGDEDKALDEYKAVTAYYAGAEARLQYGLFLEEQGDKAAALAEYQEILSTAELAPRHFRKVQNNWISQAKNGVGRLSDETAAID